MLYNWEFQLLDFKQIQMGNNNNAEQKKQKLSEYKIPQNYYETCHPNLLDFNIDEKEPYLLSAYILINSENQKWKKRLQPLLEKKYIYTPCRILTTNSFYEKGCCTSELSETIDRVNIAYEPFIYSLNFQISSRKEKQRHFTEEQLWKIMKYLIRALIQWHEIYPYQKIASIMPQNVLLNSKGNLRLVTQYSFPKDSYFYQLKPLYQSPEDKTSSVIKYSTEPNRYKILSSDLYAIGMTLLDCLILEKSQEPMFSTLNQKINHMWGHFDDKYSKQLRTIIVTLLNDDYKKRPNPHDLVQLAQANQSKFT